MEISRLSLIASPALACKWKVEITVFSGLQGTAEAPSIRLTEVEK